MDWFLVYFFVMGIMLGVVPRAIMKNVKKAVETDGFERNSAFEKTCVLLLVYAWVVVLISAGFSIQLAVGADKKFDKVNAKIERIEKQMELSPVDTLYIIKDLPKDE